MNISDLCEAINTKQKAIDKLNEATELKVAPLKLEIATLETQLVSLMHEAGMKVFKGDKAMAEIKISIRAQFDDFDKFAQFVYRNKALHLFERRIGQKAYTELKDTRGGKEIPGLKEFKQEKLTVKPL